MNDLIKTHENENGELEVSGRELHEFLEVKTAYKDWFPRMAECGFIEGKDFCSKMSESTGGRPGTDHSMTITMAKELCMLQRTDKGKQARQYFLQLEQAWNTPEMIMSRALKMADQTINGLKADNVKLTVQNTIMAPKAEYFDDLVDRNLLTGVRETAKELKVKELPFVSFLLEKKYLYRDQKGKLRPFAGHSDLFELKETMNDKTGWVGTQLLITPKGRETFRLLMI